jgi:4-amino-4-deoxy-L-arabinose transferase-like glycosyltransferase
VGVGGRAPAIHSQALSRAGPTASMATRAELSPQLTGTIRAGEHTSWWARSSTVAFLILGYLALHLALRLALGATLGIDDAEQALFAQSWSWGYRFRQPPLFTWLALPLFEGLGPGILALSVLRYALLGITFLAMYAVARRWVGEPRLAALAVFSFALIYVFAFYSHHDLTHTTALGALLALTFLAFARLVERPGLSAYLVLGACVGLGMLAKWNYVMLAGGLLLACLARPDFRPLVLSWKALPAVALAGLLVAPTALWVLAQGHSVGSVSSDILVAGEPEGRLATVAAGALALAKSTILFPQPFLVLFLLVFGASMWRALRVPRPASPTPARPVVDPEFLLLLIALTLALHALLIPLAGAVVFSERWMQPALMILPLALFALLARRPPSPRAVRAFLALALASVVLVLGVRIGQYALGADWCGKCRHLVPFAELAEGLKAQGFTRGTIVVPPEEFHIGGNLRVAFPDSRVVDPAYPPAIWPAPGEGQCLVVWRPQRDDDRARIEAFLAAELAVPPGAPFAHGQVDAPMPGSATRRHALAFALLPGGAGSCR